MAMRLFFGYLLLSLSLAGCTVPTIQAQLDQRFTTTQKFGTSPCSLKYQIALDEQGANYHILKSPSNYSPSGGQLSLPLGKTIAAYLNLAQITKGKEIIPLSFTTSDFEFSYAGGSLSKPFTEPVVAEVKYQAQFVGPMPVGEISITEESSTHQPWLWRDVAATQRKQHTNSARFYAISTALQSTTVKLLEEAHKRLCSTETKAGEKVKDNKRN